MDCMIQGFPCAATARRGHEHYKPRLEAMVHWRSPICDTAAEDRKLRQRMGGRGEVVQSGETLYWGSRRANKVRQLTGDSIDRGRPWVLGLVWISIKEFRLLKVKKKHSESLGRLIERNVHQENSVGYLCVHC
ncbi:hypothetical protein HPB48_011028 [Haemaphysalis longicornis]|uniref:Uncharacterized protein n=1 Tax=Haemaphysalis longicornis TaxID=44386 RepID=A0A9J6GWA2_HAELO|nr:hypothetical protein HPB48_011028 [Haemaphysalis longicornis]